MKSFIVLRMTRVGGRVFGPHEEFHRESYRLTDAIRIEIIRLHKNGIGKGSATQIYHKKLRKKEVGAQRKETKRSKGEKKNQK